MSTTEQFIVVWPDGVEEKWDFRCDTTFLRTVVSCTAANYNIDPRRVYFTGDCSFIWSSVIVRIFVHAPLSPSFQNDSLLLASFIHPAPSHYLRRTLDGLHAVAGDGA